MDSYEVFVFGILVHRSYRLGELHAELDFLTPAVGSPESDLVDWFLWVWQPSSLMNDLELIFPGA